MKLKPIRRSFGFLLLVDGGRLLVAPEAYLKKLQTGTPLMDDVLEYLGGNPRWSTAIACVEIALGAWLAVG